MAHLEFEGCTFAGILVLCLSLLRQLVTVPLEVCPALRKGGSFLIMPGLQSQSTR